MNAGNNAPTFLGKIEWDGDHRGGRGSYLQIDRFIMFRVLADVVLAEGLPGRKNHTDQAAIQGLAKFCDLCRSRAAIEYSVQLTLGGIEQPERSLVRSRHGKAIGENRRHQ